MDSFETSSTCFVFISHRWLRSAAGPEAHPDDAQDHKCTLILAALQRLRGVRSPVPADFEFALWIDFSCIDQDDLAGEQLVAWY